MPYGDIIVIAAVAAFIILRYRAMLGEKSGRDVESMPRPLAEYERIIQLPQSAKTASKPTKLAKDYGGLNAALSSMSGIDPEFSAEAFLEGARGAYEMVIEAYTKRDNETLRLLLSPKVYDNFKATLDVDDSAGKKTETTLIAIVKADIIDAKLRGNTASITVEFHSEQVTVVRDKDGNIIDGDASRQSAIEDHWTFERDLASSDPNWKVIET